MKTILDYISQQSVRPDSETWGDTKIEREQLEWRSKEAVGRSPIASYPPQHHNPYQSSSLPLFPTWIWSTSHCHHDHHQWWSTYQCCVGEGRQPCVIGLRREYIICQLFVIRRHPDHHIWVIVELFCYTLLIMKKEKKKERKKKKTL